MFMNDIFLWLDIHPVFWPVFIIMARITDVSIGTVRTICVVRGYRAIAAGLGFFEVVVWVLAVSGILKEITILKVLSYGMGFALGNAVGMIIENRLALGNQLIMVISRGRAHAVSFALRLADFIVTDVAAQGGRGESAMSFAIVPRRRAKDVVRIARTVDENVVIVIDDVQHVSSVLNKTAVPNTGWLSVFKKK